MKTNNDYRFPFFVSRWVQVVIDIGRRKKISQKDIFLPLENEKAECCGQNLVEAWEKRVNDKGTNAKLYLVLLRSVLGQYLTAGLFSLLEDLAMLLQPLLLRGIMLEFGQENNSTFMLWLYSLLFCSLSIFYCILDRQYYFRADNVAIKIHSAIAYLIFDKVCN